MKCIVCKRELDGTDWFCSFECASIHLRHESFRLQKEFENVSPMPIDSKKVTFWE